MAIKFYRKKNKPHDEAGFQHGVMYGILENYSFLHGVLLFRAAIGLFRP